MKLAQILGMSTLAFVVTGYLAALATAMWFPLDRH